MNKKALLLLFSVLFCCAFASAQQKSGLQQRAEAESEKGNIASTRFLYIRAYEDYVNRGQLKQGVECGVKATGLYYKENYYEQAFNLLRRIDQSIAAQKMTDSDKSALYYLTSKERMQIYIKMRRAPGALEHLKMMESYANASGNESVKNDLLYNKAIYYYTFGQNAEGNRVFKEMADKLTASKEYDKVDEVYKTLIANGRRSNSANLVAQSYSSYMAWKDSVSALKAADELAALKKQLADNEATIDEQSSSLTWRQAIIIGLCVLAAALAAALIIGGIVLLRFVLLTRKQKKVIKLANENNALKAKFISNISAQLEPTLQKLDKRVPEVQALLDFSSHIQTLSAIENAADEPVEMEDVQVQQFCESMMEQIRDKVESGVVLKVNASKLTATINREYVTHILLHLLQNAAEYTPANGTIWLEYKKRGAHTHQFLVSDTGCGIPEEKREDVFKPFLEVHDLTKGDGLGLPTCKQMALRMNGDLDIDPEFTKGTRFVLELHT